MADLIFDGEYADIPEHQQISMQYYITQGQPLGGFLTAVFSNDLCDAAIRGDLESRRHLALIASWVYHRAPAECRGSSKAVSDWLAHHGLKGKA